MKLIIYQSPTPIYTSASDNSGIIATGYAGDHLDVLSKSASWPKVLLNGVAGYIKFDPLNHFLVESDIYQLVATDAAIYLKDYETTEFVDGVAYSKGGYVLGNDYKIGDVVTLSTAGHSFPVVILELSIVIEGDLIKVVPTFQKFIERE